MRGILADNDSKGHVLVLTRILQGELWRDIWDGLHLSVFEFEDLGLADSVADDVLWHACQKHEVVLITRNRNAKGPDSLENTIRAHNTLRSLPVLTLANPERILNDETYAESVIERLLEYLLEIDALRGTGRLYLP